MHVMDDIGKKHIPKYVVGSAFNAFMFEVVKVECHYPIRVLPGDSVRVLEGNAFCDFIIELLFRNADSFKRERIAERDWWLFDLTLQRSRPQEKIYCLVSSQFNPEPVSLEAVLVNYPAQQ